MGMYTKVNLIIKIKKDVPLNVKQIIESMFECCDLEDMVARGIELPNHKFFKDERRVWFPMSSGSYYFTGTTNSNLYYRDVDDKMVLHIDTDFKNYDDEIELFLDWIRPYIDASEYSFLGYSLFESDANPTLYFYTKKEILQFINDNI